MKLRMTKGEIPPHLLKYFRPVGHKPKDRINIPHMFADAMREDGWTLRDEIVWFKPNPMPSSTQDRTTCAHEFLFMFSKKARYYYDAEAVKEKATHHQRYINATPKTLASTVNGQVRHGNGQSTLGASNGGTRNKRSVWKITPKPYKGSHYATYPPKLVEPCVLAGTSAVGCCPACWAPWVRQVAKVRRPTRPGEKTKVKVPSGWDTGPGGHGSFHRDGRSQTTEYRDAAEVGNRDPQRHVTATETMGWRPSCDCGPDLEPDACIVLDPFVGSGTTLMVATEHGRRAVGCDLDERNLKLIRDRMELVQPLLPV